MSNTTARIAKMASTRPPAIYTRGSLLLSVIIQYDLDNFNTVPHYLISMLQQEIKKVWNTRGILVWPDLPELTERLRSLTIAEKGILLYRCGFTVKDAAARLRIDYQRLRRAIDRYLRSYRNVRQVLDNAPIPDIDTVEIKDTHRTGIMDAFVMVNFQ